MQWGSDVNTGVGSGENERRYNKGKHQGALFKTWNITQRRHCCLMVAARGVSDGRD